MFVCLSVLTLIIKCSRTEVESSVGAIVRARGAHLRLLGRGLEHSHAIYECGKTSWDKTKNSNTCEWHLPMCTGNPRSHSFTVQDSRARGRTVKISFLKTVSTIQHRKMGMRLLCLLEIIRKQTIWSQKRWITYISILHPGQDILHSCDLGAAVQEGLLHPRALVRGGAVAAGGGSDGPHSTVHTFCGHHCVFHWAQAVLTVRARETCAKRELIYDA